MVLVFDLVDILNSRALQLSYLSFLVVVLGFLCRNLSFACFRVVMGLVTIFYKCDTFK